MNTLLLGLDCAASPVRMGCMLARWDGRQPALLATLTAPSWPELVEGLVEWLRLSPAPALLCMDAPLGWPQSMGPRLTGHHAGQGLCLPADALFSRLTDRRIAQRLGKRPMEVGANYIARAALAAVNLLERLRQASGLPLPLGWTPGRLEKSCALEIYPAGVLACRGLLRPGYKKTAADRAAMVGILERLMDLPQGIREACLGSEHLLDAALCCLGGADYLQGLTPGPRPEELETARKEGWIWVRDAAIQTTKQTG
ncbi:DUF429 domain-containing protein [Megalodesulfovibrio paquesii]